LIDRSGDVGHHPRPKHLGFPLDLPPIESEIVDAAFQPEKSIRGEPVESCKLRYFNSFEFFDYTGGSGIIWATARSLRVQSQQLPTESQIFEDEVLAGTESTDQPAEEMSERCEHSKNLTGTVQIQRCAKSFILLVYDAL
jgi:hypothetical protein